MKTLTITIESDKDAELLKKLLATTKFENKVEAFEEDDELDKSEIQILEERWENYIRNPSSGTSLDDFKHIATEML
jgi:hypothetical protein